MCNVVGCGKFAHGKMVLRQDKHGAPGRRCAKHGAILPKCNVVECGKVAHGKKVLRQDKHGVPGPRCVRHGEHR